jgi:hypothetical protein
MWNSYVQTAEVAQWRTAVSSKCFQLYYTCSDTLFAVVLPPCPFHLFPLLLWRFPSSRLFYVHYSLPVTCTSFLCGYHCTILHMCVCRLTIARQKKCVKPEAGKKAGKIREGLQRMLRHLVNDKIKRCETSVSNCVSYTNKKNSWNIWPQANVGNGHIILIR